MPRVAAVPRGLAARLAAVPQPRQERITDVGLALALAAVNVVALLPYRQQLHPLWLALLLVMAQSLPLIWRRSHPVAAGLVIGVARVAYDRIGLGFAPFPLGPAIAFYTIIDRCGPAWRWITCALVLAGVTISQAGMGHNEPYDAVFQALIFFTAWASGVLSRTKRASLRSAESRADRAEAELDRQTSLAAAQERTRIARELHDVVAHHVSLMAVQAEAALSVLPGRPDDARRSVEIIGDTARQALTELRRLLGVLRGPSVRPQTAPTASLDHLGDVLDQVRGAGLTVDLDVTGTPSPLAPGIDLTAYRIVQEALTNTIRHGTATRATVTLSYEPSYITVHIADTRAGSGTSAGRRRLTLADPAPAGSGHGLAGITERVASCGGTLTIGPTQAGGFAVTARLPST